MTQFGIATAKQAVVAQPEGDRFKAPRPVFQAPKNVHSLEAIAPKVKENAPAPSLKVQAETTGSDVVKRALLAASEAAKTEVPDETSKTPRAKKAKVEKVETPKVNAAPEFGPEDVCDDATFIKKTRDGNYHTPEMKRIFWANGGERHMVAGLTYAQAMSNLRTEKMRNLRK